MNTWIKRKLTSPLKELSQKRPILLLTGARQTGKTSLCRDAFKKHGFVSLDLPRLAEQAEESGEEFLKTHSRPLIIDEIQYAPALFRYLKTVVDHDRQKSGLYILTGSQKFSLMSNVSESLAGRVAILDLYSLSLDELEKSQQKSASGDQLLEWMFMGGYPELYAKNLDPLQFYSDYVATYLERDVRQALQVKNLRDFNRFMRLAALRTGQILSLSSFSSDVGVSPNTIKSWLSVLEASQIITLLEPYHINLGKRLVKTPKLYFLDTGLACFLAGFQSPDDLKKSSMLGALFETLALGQIIRWHANRGKRPQIYFLRDHTGFEVDFVIPKGDQLKLYECKWSSSPSPIRAFQRLANAISPEKILHKGILTPERGHYKRKNGETVEDCVELTSLGH